VATLTEAFEHFDAVPKNIRFAWSAFSRDRSRLVCTLWQHEFKGKNYPLWTEGDGVESPGYLDHLQFLRHAIDNRIPIEGFIVIAKNPSDGEEIKEALIDRVFHLEVAEDTPSSIVGRVIRVRAE